MVAFSPSRILTVDNSSPRFEGSAPVGNTWPWNDPDLISDFDFRKGRYWSGSLGEITLAQAFACERPSGGTLSDLAFDSDGLLVSFGPNTPRVTDLGLWVETSCSGRLDFNLDPSNAVWTKSGLTLTQDLPSPFKVGTPAGWRLTATSPDATISQTTVAIAPTAADSFTVPNALFYWNGAPLSGAIEISEDNFVADITDIRPSLVAGRWTQICGTILPLLVSSPKTFSLRIRAPGDSIGFMLANINRSATVTTPVAITGTTNFTRFDDLNRQIVANFPSLPARQKFTVLVVSVPRLFPFIPVGGTNPARRGFTTWEFNQAYTVIATGTGNLVPFGGAHPESSLMTITAVSSGTYQIGHMMVIGTGIGNATQIMEQVSGTPGGIGTYRTTSPYYLTGQTTQPSIGIQSRLPDAMGYGLNAALKPDDPIRPNAQRVGLTMTREPAPFMNYGFDPQHEDYVYNVHDAQGISVDMVNLRGIIALRGDPEYTSSRYFVGPVVIADPGHEIMYGCGGFIGGTAHNGTIRRAIVIGRDFSDAELIDATLALQDTGG